MPELTWVGKDKVINHHLDAPYRVLERQYSFDKTGQHPEDNGSENMIIHGDNLEALKSLLPRHEGQVDVIYIDPPYNTGNEGWVYNDNVNDPQIKKWLGEVVGKEGEDLSRHDKWLCMMYPRLRLLHRLLAATGVIFISIDDNEEATLKLVCDEIFGGGNYVTTVAVVNNLKGRSDDKYIATAHESLLIYRKREFISQGVPIPEEYEKEYKFSDDRGRYRLLGLRKRGANSRREDRPNLFYPFFYNPSNDTLSTTRKNSEDIEIIPKLSDGSEGNWRWGKETAEARIDDLFVKKVSRRDEFDVFQKDYLGLDNQRRVKPKSVWTGSEFSAEAGTLEIKEILGKGQFDTPKSTGLIEYCLEQVPGKDYVVLDSFAGSGTTAHAVMNMNARDAGSRRFILVELGDYAENVTAERVRRVIKGYGTGDKHVEGKNESFSYYELGEILLVNDNLNPAVPLEKVKNYIWYTETRSPAPHETSTNPYYLGANNRTVYYFICSPGEATVLDLEFLATMDSNHQGEQYVIYADRCELSDEELNRFNIVFKKIPRDITRL